MITTNAGRYAHRHYMLCDKAEQQFRERLQREATATLEIVVTEFAVAVRKAIARKDNIAAVYAVMAAHLAMKEIESDAPIQFDDPTKLAETSNLSPVGV
jgi:hypothetical protein